MLHARFLIMGLVMCASVSNVLRESCFGKEDSLQFLTQHVEILFCSHFCGLLFCRLSTLGSTFRIVTYWFVSFLSLSEGNRNFSQPFYGITSRLITHDALRYYASDMVRPYGSCKTPWDKNEYVLLRRENLYF